MLSAARRTSLLRTSLSIGESGRRRWHLLAGAVALVALLPNHGIAAICFQIHTGSVSYTGVQAPALLSGLISGSDKNWNTLTNSASSGLVYSNGSPATGVTVELGESNFNGGSVDWNATGWTTGGPVSFGGVWATNLMQNFIASTGNSLGVRVNGLPPGLYKVYGLDSVGNSVNMNSYGAIGLNISDPSPTVTQTLLTSSPSTWIDGQSDAAATLTVTSTSDWISFVMYTSDNGQNFALQGLQILQVSPLYTWTGAGAAVWSDSSSWNPAGVPGSTSPAIFSNNVNTTISLNGNRTVSSMLFDTASAGAFTFNNNTLTLGASGGITINGAVTTDQTFNSAIALAGSATLTNNGSGNLIVAGGVSSSATLGTQTMMLAGSGNGLISGKISNGVTGGSVALAVQGGAWTLSASNSYTGATTINGGTLNVAHPLALQGSTVAIGSSGALNFAAGTTHPVFGGLSGTANLALSTIASEPVTLSVGSNNLPANFGGVMSGPGGLTKVGTGMLTLSGASTYQGPTVVAGGTLKLFGYTLPAGPSLWFDASDTASLVTSGGVVTTWLDQSGNGRNANVSSGATGATVTTYNGSFNGMQTLRFAGANTYDVNMSFLTGTPYTIFAMEGLAGQGQQYILGTNSIVQNNGLYFGYRGNSDFTLAQLSNDLDWKNAPGYTGNEVAREWTGELNANGGHYIYYNGNLTPAASDNNTVSLTVNSTGIIGAGYSYNGKYNGDLGEIIIYNTAIGDADRQAVEAYLNYKWLGNGTPPTSGDILPATTPVTIAAGATLNLTELSQDIGSLSGNAGSFVQLSDGTLSTGGNGTSTTFNGSIQGAGRLIKVGSGTLTLTGTSTFAGETDVEAGMLIVTSSTGLPDGSNLTIGDPTQFAAVVPIPAAAVAAVPEPAAWALLAAGLGGAAFLRRRQLRSLLVVAALLVLLENHGMAALVFQVHTSSARYTGVQAPAVVSGLITGSDKNWNSVTASTSSGLVYSNNSPATGINVELGEAYSDGGTVDWTNSGWSTGADTFGGVWGYPLMEDYIASTGNSLGVRVNGFPPGAYKVYGLDSIGNCVNMNSYGAIGLNISDPSPTVTQTMQSASPSSRVDGQTDIAATLTVTSTSDWISFVMYTSDNGQNFNLQGLQIVQLAPLYTWTGAGTAVWSDSTSWSPAGVPGSGSPLVFSNSANTTINLNGNRTVYSLLFDTASAGAFTFNNNTLTLNSGGAITVNDTVTTDQTFNSALSLPGSATLTNNGSGNLILAGSVSSTAATGTQTLVLAGSGNGLISGKISNGTSGGAIALAVQGGVWTLSASNTFTGGTAISGGTLNVAHPLALQNSTVSLTSPADSMTFAAGVTHAAFGGLSGSGNLALNTVSSQPVTLTVGGNNLPAAYGGVLSGSGGLTKAGTGMLTLSGQSTYQGATVISGGTLTLFGYTMPAAPSLWLDAANAASLVMSGANVSTWLDQSGNARNATSSSGGTVTANNPAFNGNQTLNFRGNNYSVDLSFLKGSAYTIFSVDATSSSGPEYDFLATSGNATNGALTYGYANGHTFQLNQNNNDLTYSGFSNGVPLQWAAKFDPTSGHYLYSGGTPGPVASNSDTTPLTDSSGGHIGGGDSQGHYVYYGDIGEIIVFNTALSDADIQTIDAYLDYKWMGQGVAPTMNVLPATTPVTIAAGATLNISDDNQTVGSLSGNSGSFLQLTRGTLTTGGDGTSTTFSGTIFGTGSLVKLGSGALTLSGSATYLGSTDIQDGTLIVTSSSGLPDGSNISVGDPTQFAPAAPIPAAVAAVPEPGALALAGAAFICAMLGFRLRRKKEGFAGDSHRQNGNSFRGNNLRRRPPPAG